MSDVAAIILAAGRGSRFADGAKMLAECDGKPFVRLAAEAAIGGGASKTLVVVGHRAAAVRAALGDLAVAIVDNPAYADGLSTSLRSGFAALPAEAEAAIVLLGDMPLVGSALVAHLIAAWIERRRPAALAPVHGGRRGNPVILSRALAPEIAKLSGDSGAGALLRERADIVEWTVEDPAILLDVDTAEALERLRPARPRPG